MKAIVATVFSCLFCLSLTSCGGDNVAPEPVIDETVVGFTTVPLNATKSHVRGGETVVGNLIADAMYELADMQGHGVDVAWINGGNIRFDSQIRPNGTYPPGEISKAQVLELLPFLNSAVVVTMTGFELKSSMERSVHLLPVPEGSSGSGAFIHVSSQMQIFVDLSGTPQDLDELNEPASIAVEGTRIVSIVIDDVELDESQNYRVLMPDFIARGGDGYVRLGEIAASNKVDLGFTTASALEAYLIGNSPVTPIIENRIVITP